MLLTGHYSNLPDLRFRGENLWAVLMGQISGTDAVAAGNVKIDGSLDELQKMIKLFALREAETAGAEP